MLQADGFLYGMKEVTSRKRKESSSGFTIETKTKPYGLLVHVAPNLSTSPQINEAHFAYRKRGTIIVKQLSKLRQSN